MQADRLPSNPIFLEVKFMGNRERGVCFREREGGLGFLRSLAKQDSLSLSMILWLQLLSLPLVFRVYFRAFAIFRHVYPTSRFFWCQIQLWKVKQHCGYLGHSSALKHLNCCCCCSATLKEGNSPLGTHVWLLLDFSHSYCPRKNIRSPWAALQFFIIVPKLFIEIQWGSEQCHLSQSHLT